MPTTDHTQVSTIATASLPVPILFHPLKHHLGYIKTFIKEQSEAMSTDIGTALLSIGTSQLDFYIGTLTPLQIAREVVSYLELHNLLHPEVYHNFLTATGTHYQTITLSDATDWILRWGIVANRYVHLHPARYANQTLRVKATSLKTAIAATIAANQTGTSAHNLQLINKVRTEWLHLPPITELHPYVGAGKLIQLLREA